MPNHTVAVYLNKKLFSANETEQSDYIRIFFALDKGEDPNIRLNDLSLVAKLHLKDITEEQVLEIAYFLTQNGTQKIDSWQEHPEVELLADGLQRSSSVGDVFEWNGHFWAIAPLGFVEIYPKC